MKKFFCAAAVLLLSAGGAMSQDAESIVRASRNRIESNTTSTRSTMIIKAKDGAETRRVMDQYSKDDVKGNKRTVIVFQDPASVRGTRFLTLENSGKADDRWIFLPSLGRVRRIAASEGSGSFVGTDFSYDDISSANRKADLDRHSLLREEALNGRPCYVIESVPKDSSYQYSRMIQWIDKESRLTYRVDLYDKRSVHVKTLESMDFKDVQGRLTAMLTRMSSLTAGSSTDLKSDIVKYDDPIPETVFTTTYLETGRAR
ncbi:MAG: outer membrane lipoprotein-sorting protein [Treponema sp.]|jgi:outer membrane lipoprotein-sorting protein|nr:outer membrane lipoprotein-sorting protein [Treponema sp.]